LKFGVDFECGGFMLFAEAKEEFCRTGPLRAGRSLRDLYTGFCSS
jgi:hypothetical protein